MAGLVGDAAAVVMADRYIDFDETRVYGEYAVERIEQLVAGRLAPFDPALQYVVAALRLVNASVAEQLQAARAADATLNTEVHAREEPLAEARDVMLRYARHLESHRRGTVPYEAFFLEPSGTLAGRSPARVLAAVEHMMGALAERRDTVRDADHWLGELAAARDALAPVARTARKAVSAATASPGLVAARAQWLVVYEAAKDLVRAVLTLSNAGLDIAEVFDDLADVHRAEGVSDDDAPDDAAPRDTAP